MRTDHHFDGMIREIPHHADVFSGHFAHNPFGFLIGQPIALPEDSLRIFQKRLLPVFSGERIGYDITFSGIDRLEPRTVDRSASRSKRQHHY
jgi:hypothetical protein